jgi:hypothetical protein
MSELTNYYPDIIPRKIGVRESFESKCTSINVKLKLIIDLFLLFFQNQQFMIYRIRVDSCNLESISICLIPRFFLLRHRYLLAMYQMMQYIDV